VYAKQKAMPVRRDLRNMYSTCTYYTQILAVAQNSTKAKHQINFMGTTVLSTQGHLMKKTSEIQLHGTKTKTDLEITVSY
jgi:hypothetical protein